MKDFYYGRTKIVIPQRSAEITRDNLSDILANIMPTVTNNFDEYNDLYSVYKGHQNIENKKRPSEDDDKSIKNNKILVNHAFEFVGFKTSYLIADGFKYSQTSDIKTNDVTLLNKYYVDEDKKAKDTDRAEDMYIGGTAYCYIRPKKEKFDSAGESPFNIINLESNKTFVAYTSQIGGEEVLSGYVTKVDDNTYEYTLYTDEKIFQFNSDENYVINSKSIVETENPLKTNPIIEYPLNKSRIGVVDVVYSLFNAINIVTSNQVDNVVDYVNSILVFYNANIDDVEKVSQVRSQVGAIALDDKNPQSPAKAEYITQPLNQTEVTELSEKILKAAYDICGVAIPSGNVTSGGDTGAARSLGNGYDNADAKIKLDETSFLKAERKALKLELRICKETPGCQINEIFSSDVEINATRNNRENILSKVQALSQLHSIGFPKESSLIIVGLSSNPHELAELWEEEENKKKAEAEEKENKKLEMMKMSQQGDGNQPNQPNQPNDTNGKNNKPLDKNSPSQGDIKK